MKNATFVVAGVLLPFSALPFRRAPRAQRRRHDAGSRVARQGSWRRQGQTDSLAKGYQDPHQVEPKPSFILKLNKADLLIAVGRELEIGWLPPLVNQARNRASIPAAIDYLDASLSAHILEIPTGQLTRAMGDVHPQGNPHYWLTRERPAHRQGHPAEALRDQPGDAAYFAQRYADFDKRLAEGEKRWNGRDGAVQGHEDRHVSPLVAEFRRDIRPQRGRLRRAEAGDSAVAVTHLRADAGDEEGQRQDHHHRAVLRLKTPNAIGRDTGAQVVTLAPSVGGAKGATWAITCRSSTTT